MRTKLSILILLAACLFCSSFTRDLLTKEEAKKQIDRFTNQQIYSSFFLNKYVNKHNVPANINALKKAGYIDLVNSDKAGSGSMEIKVLSKGQPYLLKEENNELHFKVGYIPTEIISISKPVSDNNGVLFCYVEFREKVTHNPFFKVWNPHCLKEGVSNEKAKFIRNQGGWEYQPE